MFLNFLVLHWKLDYLIKKFVDVGNKTNDTNEGVRDLTVIEKEKRPLKEQEHIITFNEFT